MSEAKYDFKFLRGKADSLRKALESKDEKGERIFGIFARLEAFSNALDTLETQARPLVQGFESEEIKQEISPLFERIVDETKKNIEEELEKLRREIDNL